MPWRSTTGWTPKRQRDKHLDMYIEAVQRDVLKAYRERNPRSRHNLTLAEKNGLRSLSARKEITIKPADKGGAIVVLNTTDYIAEGNRQLGNTRFYSALDGDPTADHTEIVTNTLANLVGRGKITLKLSKSLKQLQASPGRFYMLPKIHKPGNPGRPIISGNGTLTEPLSSFVDVMIKDIPPSLPSYIKDTNHFLREISSLSIPKDSFLVTLDVSSLYTNIPHDDGIAALIEAYESHRSPGTPDGYTVSILTRLVLELNSFEFHDKFFLQISGTAMGTKMAPNYANIFMGSIESKFLSHQRLTPLFYRRYIDDIFFIWTHSEEELLKFIKDFNTVHPSIAFTHEYSKSSINFLDVTVRISGTALETKVYRKSSDRQEYLHYHSSHPRHCKNNIPYGQAHRFKRICSNESDFNSSAGQLRDVLDKQKYPKGIVDDAISRAAALDRNKLLSDRAKIRNDRPPTNLVLTYDANLPNPNKILKRHFNIIEQSPRLSQAITSPPRVTYRRSKNLKVTLVNSRVSPPRKFLLRAMSKVRLQGV
ncbi:unnamed protein product [Ixodes pacificus]